MHVTGATKENVPIQSDMDRDTGVDMVRKHVKRRRQNKGWRNKAKSVNKRWKEQRDLKAQERLDRYNTYFEAVRVKVLLPCFSNYKRNSEMTQFDNKMQVLID